VYYDGCSLISVNGEFVAQGKQFSLEDVVRLFTVSHLHHCMYNVKAKMLFVLNDAYSSVFLHYIK